MAFRNLATKLKGFSVGKQLDKFGFAVVDDALSESTCRSLKHEIQSLHSHSLLHSNVTLSVQKGKLSDTTPKEGVFELSLDHVMKHAPVSSNLLQEAQTCEFHATLVDGNPITSSTSGKVLYNQPGGCFNFHCDTLSGFDGRQITAILYLNENWKHNHGGELVLAPFPYEPVTISPVFNRMVLFSSKHMIHRTLPAQTPRYALLLWMHGITRPDKRGAMFPVSGSVTKEEAAAATVLLHPTLRQHWTKIVMEEEWALGIREAFDSTIKDDMEAEFREEVRVANQLLESFLAREKLPSNPRELGRKLFPVSPNIEGLVKWV